MCPKFTLKKGTLWAFCVYNTNKEDNSMNKRIKIDRNNKLISCVLLLSMLLSVICVFPSYAEGEATE